MRCKIPLMFFGENRPVRKPIGDTESAKRDWSYFTVADKSKVSLGGVSVPTQRHFGVEQQDLILHSPADSNQIEEQKVELPRRCHRNGIPRLLLLRGRAHGGFQASPERTPGTPASTTASMIVSMVDYYTTGQNSGLAGWLRCGPEVDRATQPRRRAGQRQSRVSFVDL